jgi:hypothetical protein
MVCCAYTLFDGRSALPRRVGCDRHALGQTTVVSIVVVASISGQPMQSTCSLYGYACVWSSCVLALQRRHHTRNQSGSKMGGFVSLLLA